MTTARSPLRLIKAQADKIAATLKAAERGEKIDVQFGQTIAAAREKEAIVFGVMMDDKLLRMEIPWAKIRECSEVALSEWIVKHMRERRETMQ